MIDKIANAIHRAKREADANVALDFYRHLAYSAIEAMFEDITRIDMVMPLGTGPIRREYWADSWKPSIQDDGQTLKIFGTGSGLVAQGKRDVALAAELVSKISRT